MLRAFSTAALCMLWPTGLEAQVILPLLFKGEPVAQVHHAMEDPSEGTVWFATKKGLFYTPPGGNALSDQPAEDGRLRELWHIARVDNDLWVGGEGGVYRIRNPYEKITTNLPADVTVFAILTESITDDDETLWLATSQGVFQRRAGGDFDLKLPGESTFLGFADHGKEYTQKSGTPEDRPLWASNENGVYTFNLDTRNFEEFAGHNITNVDRIFRDKNGQVYLWRNEARDDIKRVKEGTSLYKHPSGERVGISSTEPLDVEIVDGLLWYSIGPMIRFLSTTGDKRMELCGDDIQSEKTIEESRDYIWIIHRYGIHRHAKSAGTRCKQLTTSTDDNYWDLSSILETQTSNLFFYGLDGVYGLHEGIVIDLSIAKHSLVFFNIYTVRDSGYYDTGSCSGDSRNCDRWRPPEGVARRFSAIIAASEQELDRKIDKNFPFEPVNDWVQYGYQDSYYVSFHDYYGNTKRIPHSMAVPVATYYIVGLVFWGAYILITGLLVLVMPRRFYLFVRNLLYSMLASASAPTMLRPLLLLVPGIMRRRLRDVYADGWLKRYGTTTVVPADLMRRIESRNEVFLESDEGDRVNLNDIASEIFRRTGKDKLRNSIPLVCDLRDFETRSARGIRNQMALLVRQDLKIILWFSFISEEFCSKLIERGDFVFLFYCDGCDEKLREAAREFARKDDSQGRLVMSGTAAPQEGPASAKSEPGSGAGSEAGDEEPQAAAAPSSETAPQPPPAAPPEEGKLSAAGPQLRSPEGDSG